MILQNSYYLYASLCTLCYMYVYMYIYVYKMYVQVVCIYVCIVCMYVCMYMWPDLPKGVLYTYSFKTHFSSSFVSNINEPTAHVFNTAEGWTFCFHSGLFLKPVWCPWALRWLPNSPIYHWQADSQLWVTTQLVDGFVYEFSCFAWHVEVKIAPMEAIWLFLVKM